MPCHGSGHQVREDIYIGLGSNMGDRAAAVFQAVEQMDAVEGVQVVRLSTLFESAAVDVVDQPDFVNAVALVRTRLEPLILLGHLRSIEEALGRVREGAVPRGPRPIDLDVLLWGDRIIEKPGLRVPHPRMNERAFVLLPMVELDAEATHPSVHQTMHELLLGFVSAHGPIEDHCRVMSRTGLDRSGDMLGPAMKDAH